MKNITESKIERIDRSYDGDNDLPENNVEIPWTIYWLARAAMELAQDLKAESYALCQQIDALAETVTKQAVAIDALAERLDDRDDADELARTVRLWSIEDKA